MIYKSICECWHGEEQHTRKGFRPCTVKGCDCSRFIEEDAYLEAIGDPEEIDYVPMAGPGPYVLPAFILAVWVIMVVSCIGIMGSKESTGMPGAKVAPVDTVDKKHVCPKGCKCDMVGVILECPDPKPPAPGLNKKGATK